MEEDMVVLLQQAMEEPVVVDPLKEEEQVINLEVGAVEIDMEGMVVCMEVEAEVVMVVLVDQEVHGEVEEEEVQMVLIEVVMEELVVYGEVEAVVDMEELMLVMQELEVHMEEMEVVEEALDILHILKERQLLDLTVQILMDGQM